MRNQVIPPKRADDAEPALFSHPHQPYRLSSLRRLLLVSLSPSICAAPPRLPLILPLAAADSSPLDL
uniref:Uncharacterized protein n=1 Tax=Triticum urartu TaxID=4572 RepID=A0A8R7R7V8_TRIUA